MSLLKKKAISDADQLAIEQAIQQAEKQTSGEIKVVIEKKYTGTDPVKRSEHLFKKLTLFKTKERNGVLIYVAIKNHQLAVYGDKGIYEKLGAPYWGKLIEESIVSIRQETSWVQGLITAIESIGNKLKKYYPYQEDDTNELSDKVEVL